MKPEGVRDRTCPVGKAGKPSLVLPDTAKRSRMSTRRYRSMKVTSAVRSRETGYRPGRPAPRHGGSLTRDGDVPGRFFRLPHAMLADATSIASVTSTGGTAATNGPGIERRTGRRRAAHGRSPKIEIAKDGASGHRWSRQENRSDHQGSREPIRTPRAALSAKPGVREH